MKSYLKIHYSSLVTTFLIFLSSWWFQEVQTHSWYSFYMFCSKVETLWKSKMIQIQFDTFQFQCQIINLTLTRVLCSHFPVFLIQKVFQTGLISHNFWAPLKNGLCHLKTELYFQQVFCKIMSFRFLKLFGTFYNASHFSILD